MKKNTRIAITLLLLLAFTTMACKITLPGSGTVDDVATSVAKTVNALAEASGVELTTAPSEAATESPEVVETLPPPVVYPLRIAYVAADHNLFTADESMASPLQLTTSSDVDDCVVSPDGTLIAFTRYSGYSITSLNVINADGTNERLIMDAAGFAALPRPADSVTSSPNQLVWVPGTHTLAMSTRIEFMGPGYFVGDRLYLFNIDTMSQSSILSMAESWGFTFSPDGTKVAIAYPTGIDTYALNGTKIAGPILVYEFVNTASEYAWNAWPQWSTDSTTLVADVPPVEPFPYGSTPLEDSTVWRMSADGLSGELLFSTPIDYRSTGSVAYSKDLTKVLYYVRITGNTLGLHTANIDGTNNVEYATGEFNRIPVWSPDNSHFFYAVRSGSDNTPYIGVVGGLPVAIVDYNNAMEVKWIDENRYLVTTNNGHRWRLLLGNIGAATGLVYDSMMAYSDMNNLNFSVNR